MRRIILLLLVAILAAAGVYIALTYRSAAPASSLASGPPERSTPLVRRVLIVSIDGLRPDLALHYDMPNLRGLMAAGCYTFWARTTQVSITLPSHVSMLTGVTPAKHGVTWNSDGHDGEYPRVPTLFELAKADGLTTAMVSNKDKFCALAKPGSVDYLSLPSEGERPQAPEIAATACEMLRLHQPNVMLIHFGDPDNVGHVKGWATPAQRVAIERGDEGLGLVLKTLREMPTPATQPAATALASLDAPAASLYATTLLIVTADHGGAGRSHGPNDPRSRHIPWIATGPGLRKDYDLTRNASLVVNTEDTFATACYFLGLPRYPYLDGKPITQIREGEAVGKAEGSEAVRQ